MEDLTKYIYGATRLGDDGLSMAARIDMATAAMASGVWFHVSHEYGNALEVLRAAFDRARDQVPKMIFKIGFGSMDELRATVTRDLDALGIDAMDVGQLCLVGDLAADFRSGGPSVEELAALKASGRVRRFVLEVFPWSSDDALAAIRSGAAERLVDAFIFYLNPLQRFASNELWDELHERGLPIVAMRTVAGNHVHALRDVPGAAWKPYLQERATEVAPVFDASGVDDWSEFCVRFAHGFERVQATVGSTARRENLAKFLSAVADPIEPLPAPTMDALVALQRRWADEFDANAEPWSM